MDNVNHFLEFGIEDHQKTIAVFDDHSYVICPDKDLALKMNPSYAATRTINGYFIVSGKERAKFSWEILNADRKVYLINNNGWKDLDIEEHW